MTEAGKQRSELAPEHSDQSLLRRFRSGEDDAATALYVRYARRLLGLANYQTADPLRVRFDPDDVVQSVFRTFFRRAAEGYYEVPPGDELWNLLLVIALNKIRRLAEHHRAAKRDTSKTRSLGELETNSSGDGQEEQSLQILQMVIADLLREMPEDRQRIVRLRIEGNSVPEIAEQADVSKRSVERVLQKFRGDLSAIIGNAEDR